MARTSELDKNPDLIEQFAETYSEHNSTRAKLSATFGVSKDTVSRWTKDPRVQAALTRIREERVNAMSRRVDGKLIMQLERGDFDDDPELLIKLRRELIPRDLNVNVKNDADQATMELYRKVLGNPDLARALGAPAIDTDGDDITDVHELPSGVEE